MVRSLSLLYFAIVASVVGTYAQSNTPGCFHCPPQDGLNFAVGQKNENTDPIFCSYPAVEGEDPNDFFCTYSATTGALVEDHDAGLCPATAVNSCITKKRRDALPRSPKAAHQARAPNPAHMQERSKLKKRRLSDA